MAQCMVCRKEISAERNVEAFKTVGYIYRKNNKERRICVGITPGPPRNESKQQVKEYNLSGQQSPSGVEKSRRKKERIISFLDDPSLTTWW